MKKWISAGVFALIVGAALWFASGDAQGTPLKDYLDPSSPSFFHWSDDPPARERDC